MNRGDLELVIQDYLDDRMDPEERARFEDRIAADPELAETIADHRAVGDTLRDGNDDLPERFYTDARQRFVTEHGGRKIHDSFSWESAGLLAAALLVAAILLPVVWQQGLMRSSKPASETLPETVLESKDSPAVDEIRGSEIMETEAEEPRDAASAVEADAFAPSPTEDPKLDDDRAEPLSSVGYAGREELKKEKNAPKDEYEEAASEPAEDYGQRSDVVPEDRADKRRQATSPPVAQAPSAAADAPAKLSRTREAADQESYEKSFAAEGQVAPARSAALATGVVPVGAVIQVPSADAWARWLERVGGVGAERLAPRFPDERVILLGPRPDPLDCQAIVPSPSGGLRVPIAPPGSGAEGGCAVVVDDAGAEIEFVPYRAEP